MKTIPTKKRHILTLFSSLAKTTHKEQGLTLVEVLVSSVVMIAGMLAIFPLFAAPKFKATDNELRKAEAAIAQNIVDEVRKTPWEILETLDGEQDELPPTSIGGTGESLLAIEYGGRTYDASITYCPDVLTDPIILDENENAIDVCAEDDANSIKVVRVEIRRVNWGGYKLDNAGNVQDGQYYTVDTIFTNLQDE